VNETLVSRIGELSGGRRGQKSGGQSKAKAQASS